MMKNDAGLFPEAHSGRRSRLTSVSAQNSIGLSANNEMNTTADFKMYSKLSSLLMIPTKATGEVISKLESLLYTSGSLGYLTEKCCKSNRKTFRQD